MYTQCPKCQSVFMVTEQDLSSHEGLVRCGNCYSVFNAGANLTDDPQDAASQEPAIPAELPAGANATTSGMTFSFIAEPDDSNEDEASPDTHKAEDTSTEADAGEETMEPFPDPDFEEHEDGSSDDDVAEDTADDGLVYFGPDHATDLAPAAQDDTGDSMSSASELLSGHAFHSDTDSAEETDSGFALPDFSPLEGLDTDSDTADMPATSAGKDEPAVSNTRTEPVETHLSAEALWPGDDFPDPEHHEEEAAGDRPSESIELLPELASDVRQAFGDDAAASKPGESDVSGEAEPGNESRLPADEGMPIIELGDPLLQPDSAQPLAEQPPETHLDAEPAAMITGQEMAAAENDAGTEAGEAVTDETEAEESVFITSPEEEVDETYQSINVKDDLAFHGAGSNDFKLPDEIEGFEKYDDSDLDKLLEQAAREQVDIDTKLSANDEADEPELGTPDIDDELDDEPVLNPARPVEDTGVEEKSGLLHGMSAGVAHIADKLRIGRRSYHGLDTQEAEEQTNTVLAKQLEQQGQGSPFAILPRGIRSGLLVLANLVLIVALIFQLGKYFMDDLVQIQALRPLLEAGCQLTGCQVPEASNPAAIEQLSSKMTVLKGQQDGLRIAVTLINRDATEQPFPALELSLTDRSGRIISRKVVKAEDYLGSVAQSRLMQPGQAEDVNILLHTPAVRVDGFELRPVKLHWLSNH